MSEAHLIAGGTVGLEEVLRVEEVAAITTFSRDYIYRLASEGKIPHHRPTGRTILFMRSEVMDWLRGSREHEATAQ